MAVDCIDAVSISIITVCLNAASAIEITLKSVLEQKFARLEYIVVDGLSSDGTLDIINKYRNQLTHVISEPDKGIYDAFNKGLQLATGGIVGILNAGDQYAPWTLSTIAQNVLNFPEGSIFYGKLLVIDDASNKWTLYPLGDYKKLFRSMSIAHPATFVKRAMYEKYGLFNIKYKIAGDWDFMLRLYNAGETFIPISKILTTFDSSGISSKQSCQLLIENSCIYLKYSDLMLVLFRILKMLIKYVGKKIVNGMGIYRVYANWRDKRIAEVSGEYRGSVETIWNAICDMDE